MQSPPADQTRPALAQGTPLTGQEVEAARIKLRDLRNELQDAAERRNSVASRLNGVDEGARPGMMARLNELDGRIITLEREITATGSLLRNAPPGALVSGTREDVSPAQIAREVTNDIVPIVAIVTIFFLAPIAFAIARLIWRRANVPARQAVGDTGTQQRLDQLQHAVDTIAIEVERISEGQRFVTRLLSERERSALGGGSTERR